jgi:FixJ family two-component response regulator
LPGLSGLDLQEQLAAEGLTVPIVFITAYADDQAREQALRAGAIAFLQKPFEEQALLEAVARAVG